ncbi:MAG TPA: DUF342 domain-containing protein [Firmicutes bacterium]|nr:DUF342 domain-containing protein [Bacillota bacterium]
MGKKYIQSSYSTGKDGTIEIKNGLVRINDPAGEGRPAVILNDPKATITVNGQAIDRSRQVYSADKVEITPIEERIPGSLQVELAEGGMSAKIKVSPGTIIKRAVRDVPPNSELVLSYDEEHVSFNDITVGNVQAALREKGIIFGIDLQQVEKAVNEASGQFETVARGEEVINGSDGYVELLFAPEIEISSYNENSLSKVDYKEKIVIPAVNKGDVLAVIHPPRPGTPGRLVTGKVVEPPSVKEIKVKCKGGCELSPEGDKVWATCTGRPIVEGRQRDVFRVVPLHIHRGDVDVKSGNLRFRGELKITGDIMEGMTVESPGNIEVLGNTAGAQVISGGSIIFRNNLINSRVVAGILMDYYLQIEPLLEEIEKIFLSLNSGIGQLKAALSNRGKKIDESKTGYLIKLFIERKFEALPELLKKLLRLSKEKRFSLTSQAEKALQEIEHLCTGDTGNGFPNIRRDDDIKRVVQALSAVRLSIKESKNIEGDIIASYIQNSTLNACGNISVQGTGCYNSIFKAGGDIQIKGVFRGGKITAGGRVYIGEAGSPGLLLKQGKINLSPDSEAVFRKIYENVQISFGKRTYRFEETRSMVKVFFSKEEDLIKIIHI